jgi:3-hydroxyacyl-CoA dehydrogenase
MTSQQTIGVIGAGTIGNGIAQVAHRPAPLLKEMVAQGRLGRKSGRGFHTYT